jgi:hypothetical protein
LHEREARQQARVRAVRRRAHQHAAERLVVQQQQRQVQRQHCAQRVGDHPLRQPAVLLNKLRDIIAAAA